MLIVFYLNVGPFYHVLPNGPISDIAFYHSDTALYRSTNTIEYLNVGPIYCKILLGKGELPTTVPYCLLPGAEVPLFIGNLGRNGTLYHLHDYHFLSQNTVVWWFVYLIFDRI